MRTNAHTNTRLEQMVVRAVIATLAVGAVGCAPAAASHLHSPAPASSKGDAHPMPCGPTRIGSLARLAGGRSPADVGAAGYSVRLELTAPPDDALVVVGPPGTPSSTERSLAARDLDPLVRQGIVAAVADVMSQSAKPGLASCSYYLSDRVAAAPLVDAAEHAAVAQDLLSQAGLAHLGVRMISDDPFNASDVLVSLQVPDGSQTIAPPVSPEFPILSTHDVVALVNTSSDEVTAIASGSWS